MATRVFDEFCWRHQDCLGAIGQARFEVIDEDTALIGWSFQRHTLVENALRAT